MFTPCPPQGGRGKRKGFVFTPTVPLKGEGEKEGFPQGFIEWSGLLLLVCLVMLRGKPLIICLIGRLAKQALDYIHPACFCLSAENISPSRGTRVWGRVCRVLSRVWSSGLSRVLYRVFILLANHGAYTFHFHTSFIA